MNQSKKLIAVASIGTVLEWFEFTFYAYIATLMSQLFFPRLDSRVAIMATFGVFAMGYLMRPLGAILFGYLGDCKGRLVALQYSILLMGLSAFCIGLLPTYHQWGIAAPILLLTLRCLQGLAVSGEFNGSSIFLMEHANKNLYFAASWTGWASAVGMMLGSLAAMVVVLPTMAQWTWRIPFLSGALICGCGFYLRRQFSETPVFTLLLAQRSRNSFPLLTLFKQHLKPFLLAALVATAFGIFIYVGNVYYATYLIQSIHLAAYQAKLVVTVGSLFTVIFFPIIAKLADQKGGLKIMRWGFVCIILAGPLLYFIALSHLLILIFISQVFYALADAMVGAPLFHYLNDLFPTSVRYTGASFAWSASMAIFAGTAPLLSAWLQQWSGVNYTPAFYISLAGILGLIGLTYAANYEKQGKSYASTKALGS